MKGMSAEPAELHVSEPAEPQSHLKEKVTPVFNTRYTLPHLPSYLAEFSNYAELCTFEYTVYTTKKLFSRVDKEVSSIF